VPRRRAQDRAGEHQTQGPDPEEDHVNNHIRRARALSLAAFASLSSLAAAPVESYAAQAGPEAAARTRGAAPLETQRPASARPWQRYRVDSQGSSWPQTNWKDYSSVDHLDVTLQAPSKLGFETPISGDAARGQALAFDRSRGGSCVVCHIMGATTPSQPGNVGPDLSQIGANRTDDWLFNYVYDARAFNKDTIMPPWGAHRVYNVAEIRDIVAFLKTLKSPHAIKDTVENPATRPVPVENRDNLDATENPAMFAQDTGKRVYSRPGPTGKACVSCHAEPEKAFKTWAASMPRVEPRMNKVLGIEEFITRHARATTGDDLLMQSEENLGMSIYLRHLANGTPMNADTTSPAARQAIARATKMMRTKLGQLNMACVDCHTKEKHANKWVRGQYLVEFKGTVAHFPTWRTSRGDIWDIRKRFQWCNVSIRANELPPDAPEYGDIELALAALNKGEKLNVPGIRH